MNDLDGCVVTFEQTRTELEAVEQRLAERLQIKSKCIRCALIEMDIKNILDEDELVRDWRSSYSSYIDWLENP